MPNQSDRHYPSLLDPYGKLAPVETANAIKRAYQLIYEGQPDVLSAASRLDINLTTEQDVTGATVTLNRTGKWLILGNFTLTIDASANAASFEGKLSLNGTNETKKLGFTTTTTGQTWGATLGQSWFVTVTDQPVVATLRVVRTAGTGTITVYAIHTGIEAIFLGP